MSSHRSLRQKLITTTVAVLAVVSLSTLGGAGWQSWRASQADLAAREGLLRQGLDSKGRLIADNHALALRGMVEGNAFGDVKALVGKTVAEDPQIVYGLFLDEGGRPWAWAERGVDEPAPDAWQKLGIPEGDPASTYREVGGFGEPVWEFAAPVVVDGERVGVVRYGVSTASMTAAVSEARTQAQAALLTLLGLVGAVGAVALIGGSYLMVGQARRITGPLQNLTAAADRIARGEKGARADVKSGDELEVLAGSFNQMVADLEDLNAGLEKKVEERTREVSKKSDDISRMLNNIQQGIFTLLPDLTLHPEYSAHLEQLVGVSDLAGRSFEVLFLDRSSLGSADRDSAAVVLKTSFGNPAFLFECNAHLLPRSFTLRVDGVERQVELEYVGIEDEAEDLANILVIARDVTELKRLEREALAQREALAVVGELLEVQPRDAERFFDGARSMLSRNRDIVLGGYESERVNELFRNAHTIKGNARLLGFSRLNDVVHEAEELYRGVRDGGVAWEEGPLLAGLETVAEAIGAYELVFREKLAGRNAAEGGVPVDRLQALVDGAVGPEVLDDLRALLREVRSVPFSDVVAGPATNARAIAKELGKAVPEVRVVGGEVRLDPVVAGVWRDVLVHVLRNAVDHGLETPDERRAAGKPETGTIQVLCREVEGRYRVLVRDDGAGLKLDRLRVRTGLHLPNDLAESLFQSGVSTAERVTSISGRGVGMDAVRSFLSNAGGGAWITVDEGVAEDADRAGFTLVLESSRDGVGMAERRAS